MNVQEAVRKAKTEIQLIFSEEQIRNVGLEEVEFDQKGHWNVTVGFSRPWDRETSSGIGLAAVIAQGGFIPRSYKVVRINDSTGAVVSIRDRVIEKPSSG